MKITYLLTTADAVGGTERAVFNQASELAARHDVRVLSVFKSRREQFFTPHERVRLDYLIDLTSATPRPLRTTGVDDAVRTELAAHPSRIVDRSWEAAFSRLSDLELELALQATDTDVLVTTTPALMALAVELAPAHVVTVHQEHRVSELRGTSGEPLRRYTPRLDALAVLSERTRDWFAETLGDAAPRLEVVPNALPGGFRPRSTLQTRTVVIAGRLVAEKQIDHAVTAWAAVSREHPDWQLRIFGDGPLSGALRRQIDTLGLHDCVQLNGNSSTSRRSGPRPASPPSPPATRRSAWSSPRRTRPASPSSPTTRPTAPARWSSTGRPASSCRPATPTPSPPP